MEANARESWGSRAGFILATAGYAVGLGNIWRFPYVVGENGGGAFLLVYVAFAFLIGVPLMTMELSLGRKAQLSPIAGMARLTGSKKSPWTLAGWLGVGTIVLIISYYLMLVSWILAYAGLIGLGKPLGATPEQTAQAFNEFTTRPGAQVLISLLVCLGLVLVIRRGLQAGLEGMARVAMPLLVLMMVGLAAWSVSLPGAGEGLAWLFTPDFSALSADAVLAALGQAFYSIGIGMAVAFGFGSYLPPGRSDIPGSVAIVVTVDTLMAVLAGLVIFPALFAMGMAPDSGPTLLFVTMTAVFEQMPGGQLFGFLFFALLTVAALTSVVAAFELLTSVVTDSLGMPRRGAAATVGLGCWALSVVVIMSQGPWSGIRVAGRDLFSFLDHVSGNYMLTSGALIMALFVAYRWGWTSFRDETNQGSGRFKVTGAWRPLVQWIIPVAVGTVLLIGLGVF